MSCILASLFAVWLNLDFCSFLFVPRRRRPRALSVFGLNLPLIGTWFGSGGLHTGTERSAQQYKSELEHIPLRSGFTMTTIPDVQLYAHSERVEGKVVLITGEKDVLRRAPLVFSFPSSLCRGRSRYWEGNRSAVRKVEVRLCVG